MLMDGRLVNPCPPPWLFLFVLHGYNRAEARLLFIGALYLNYGKQFSEFYYRISSFISPFDGFSHQLFSLKVMVFMYHLVSVVTSIDLRFRTIRELNLQFYPLYNCKFQYKNITSGKLLLYIQAYSNANFMTSVV